MDKSFESTTASSKAVVIDAERARFPYCIVWTPLPLISWFLPFIGHTGIAMSNGVIHDFAGPYTVTIDDLAFGETHKYVPLQITDDQMFDRAVLKADSIYENRNHNICCDNCHSHVAKALSRCMYQGKDKYTMVDVWWLTVTQSKYVSWVHVIKTYLGFFILVALLFSIKFVI